MPENLQPENEKISGTVTAVIYSNSQNGYAVCEVENASETFTAVGYMPYISEGERVTLTGAWTFHRDYGPQFKTEFYEKSVPTAAGDILKYLSGGCIKGIREATAMKIVDMFGEDTLNVLENEPEKLAKVQGISKKRALEIGDEYAKQQGVRNVVMFLQKFEIAPASAVKIFKKYGISSIDKIKENPYILSDSLYNIGFRKADKIALEMGFAENAKVRLEAALKHLLSNAAVSGHTYLPKPELTDALCSFLKVSGDEAENAVIGMIFENKLKNEIKDGEPERIYLPQFYKAEVYVANKLLSIAKNKPEAFTADIEELLKAAEEEQNISLAIHQKSAVFCALKNGAAVITGGPGTGKTTIIKTVIRIFENLGKKVALAAPTGRAAKRMSEVCETEAKTIHRLLESGYSDEGGDMRFFRNEENPIDCDVIIVDEMSMVDIVLMSSLLKAMRSKTRLIMVGDSDQLPSVGPGYVLHDIISSGAVAQVALTEIFRQAKESDIVVNAHKINRGEYPTVNRKNTDFFLVKRETAVDISSSVLDLYMNRLPKAYRLNPLYQIQVLAPTRKGIAGVGELNTALQKVINPPSKTKRERLVRGMVFREGDKVMQTRNNYDMEWTRLDDEKTSGTGIFNGDIGFIHKIDKSADSAEIVFDDKLCIYEFSKMEDLDLAYAVTVHKSQGSEFDAVVIPMYPCAPMLQNRNLLYTAVTRAKRLVVIVGREDCLRKMVDNVNEQTRYSGLYDKLCGGADETVSIFT